MAPVARAAPHAAVVHAAPELPSPPPRRAAQELSYGALPEVLGYHLRRAQVALFKHYSRSVAAQTGLTPGLLGMLQVIAANPGLAQSRLAEAMGVDRSTIVKVVDQLEARELIVREPSPSDKRSHCLRLTAGGAAELPRMQRLMRRHEDEFAQPLSADERRTLIELLARLHERCEGEFDAAARQRG